MVMGSFRSVLPAFGIAAAAAITLVSAGAAAQQPPPPTDPNAAPPPTYYAPPPGGYPPGYAPPPGAYPPGGYAPPPGSYGTPYASPAPRTISDWDESQPIPAGYHKTTKVRIGLVVGGAVTFSVMYLSTALAGAIASDVGAHSGKLLFIPIAGPLAVLGGSNTAVGDFFLVLDTLVQAGGIAMLACGIALPKVVLVRNDVGKSKFEIMPKPMTFGMNGGGLGFVGRF